MREQREPWLRLPAKTAGSIGKPRLDPRFRTHVVPVPRAVATPADPPPQPVTAPLPEPGEPETEPLLAVDAAQPTDAAIERAAAAAAISKGPDVRLAAGAAPPRPLTQTPPPPPEPVETRAPGGAEIGFDDLAPVSSTDWAVKVGDAAKMVDVVVVFYTAAHVGSEMFEFAFQAVVNEVLPRLGRPYAVYRFSLDAEPGFVPEMAASLGLPPDNPVTAAGFAWSGPGRRLFILGDHALGSPAMFQRSLRRSLTGAPAEVRRDGAARRQPAADLERAARPWGRVLAILAWCLFGTAALGAAAVGVAPQWASSLLHPASVPAPGEGSDSASPASNAPLASIPPTASPDNTGGTPPAEADQSKATKTVKHAKKKQTPSSLSSNPTYWGLPAEATRAEAR